MTATTPISYRGSLIFGFLILALGIAGGSMIMRLSNELNAKDVKLSEMQSTINRSIISNEQTMEAFSKQLTTMLKVDGQKQINTVEVDDSSELTEQVNSQDELIATILAQNEELFSQVEALKRQVSDDAGQALSQTDELGAQVGGQEFIDTPEGLEAISKQQIQESIRTTELVFQEQLDNTVWASETEQVIQTEIAQVLEKPEYQGLDVSNLDCRESMCKLEVNQSADAAPGNFDVELQFAIAGQLSSGMVNIHDNGDGTSTKTYYFSK